MIRRRFVFVLLLACSLVASATFAADLPTESVAEIVDADAVETVAAATSLLQEPLSWLELDVAGWVAVGTQGSAMQPMASGPGLPVASAQCPSGRNCTSTEQCRAFCCDQVPGVSGGVCAQNISNPSVQCCFCGFFQGCGE
ncbi:MAG: hypothetical protein AAGE94_06475 [Acidobacteriota bacterium]